jgi:hypothetical protein
MFPGRKLENCVNPVLVNNGFIPFMQQCLKWMREETNRRLLSANDRIRQVFFLIYVWLCCDVYSDILQQQTWNAEIPFNEVLSTLLHLPRRRDLEPRLLNLNKKITVQFIEDMETQIVGACKTIVVLNLPRVLAIRTERILTDQFPNVTLRLMKKVAKVLNKHILGAPGTLVHEPDDEEEGENVDDDEDAEDGRDYEAESDDSDDEETAEEQVQQQPTLFNVRHGNAPDDIAFIAHMNAMTVDALVQNYLPGYLAPLRNNWQHNLSANGYRNAPLVWRLFSEVNAGGFVQQILPGPNSKAT